MGLVNGPFFNSRKTCHFYLHSNGSPHSKGFLWNAFASPGMFPPISLAKIVFWGWSTLYLQDTLRFIFCWLHQLPSFSAIKWNECISRNQYWQNANTSLFLIFFTSTFNSGLSVFKASLLLSHWMNWVDRFKGGLKQW